MILMIEPSGRAGLGHYTYNLCHALSERGKEVHLLTATEYELDGYPINFYVERVFNKYRTNPFKLLAVLHGFRTRKPQIVHFQGADHPANYLILLYMLRAVINCPVVYTAHNITPRRPSSASKKVGFLLRNLYEFVDRIIVHSEINLTELRNLCDLRPQKIKVIPHGDYTFFASNKEAGDVMQNHFNEKIILFFGFIVRIKGLVYLIRAMKEVVDAVPEAKLLIVGLPLEDFTYYSKEIQSLGLENRVTAVLEYVPIDDLSRYFSRSHIVALPYLDVSQSGVLQVAFAFGKPVVATTTGGLTELVEEGKGGFLVPPGDSSRLAHALTAILKDDAMRRKMGEHNFKIARERNSWHEIAEKTEMIYMDLTAL